MRKSYGIICYRKHKIHGFQIILVKKTVTYYFCEFVYGKYRKTDDFHLKRLFNGMTFNEKIDILSLNFNTMWYRIYKNTDNNKKLYEKKKEKFEANFLYDNGLRLKKLISNTCNTDTIWELPKGRMNQELDKGTINSAIREFTEESNISENLYDLNIYLNPYVETYMDFGVIYQNVYYIARAIGDWKPFITFCNSSQISEVSDIKWCNRSDILKMELPKEIHNRTLKLFDKIKKKLKRY